MRKNIIPGKSWVLVTLLVSFWMLAYKGSAVAGGTISSITFDSIPPDTVLAGGSILLQGEVAVSGSMMIQGDIQGTGTVCGAAGCIGDPSDNRRPFYLTQSLHQGSTVLSACQAGFHMASLWEILSVSDLRYATEVSDAAIQADSGQGPPSDLGGWIRTGWLSNSGTIPGNANCDTWTSSGESRSGTLVKLQGTWDLPFEVDWLGPWNPAQVPCSTPIPVWCVAD
jgi:hypothetical protein